MRGCVFAQDDAGKRDSFEQCLWLVASGKPNVYFFYFFLLFLTFLQKSRKSNPLYFFLLARFVKKVDW